MDSKNIPAKGELFTLCVRALINDVSLVQCYVISKVLIPLRTGSPRRTLTLMISRHNGAGAFERHSNRLAKHKTLAEVARAVSQPRRAKEGQVLGQCLLHR